MQREEVLFNFISDNGERNIPESLMKSLVSFKLEDFDLLDESDVMQDTSIADSDKMFFKLCIRRYKQQKPNERKRNSLSHN